MRNQHPAQLTALQLTPASAAVLPQGAAEARLGFAYSSLFLSQSNGQSTFVMDGEVMRTGLGASVGLGCGLELGIEVPVLHTTGGFLDSFLIGYHELFGLPDQGRSDREKGQFEVYAQTNGARVYELREADLMLADVPLSLTYCLVPPGRTDGGAGLPGVALRAGLELPVGDEDRGAGNGEVDWALGAACSWPLPCGALHLNAQHSWVGSPRSARDAGFAFADVGSASAALECGLLPDLDGLIQVSWEQATLRELGLERTDRDAVLLWTGARLCVDESLWLEVALGEDLSSYIAPDVTFWIGMQWARTPRSWRS